MGKLLGKSWTDDNAITITSEAGTYLKENLQNVQPGKIWRSTDLTDQVITCNFGQQRETTGFAIYAHNFSDTSEITFEVFKDTGLTNLIYTTTFPGTTPVYGWGTQPLGLYGLGGYSDEGIVQTFSTHWTSSVVVGQSIRVTISDPSNPDGYIEAGRLKIGAAVDVPFAPGYSMGFAEQTSLTRTRGGALRSDNRPSYRWATIDTTLLDITAEARLMDLFEAVGRRSDVLWTAFPGESNTRERRNTILGRITSGGGSSITNEGATASFTIEEAL